MIFIIVNSSCSIHCETLPAEAAMGAAQGHPPNRERNAAVQPPFTALKSVLGCGSTPQDSQSALLIGRNIIVIQRNFFVGAL